MIFDLVEIECSRLPFIPTRRTTWSRRIWTMAFRSSALLVFLKALYCWSIGHNTVIFVFIIRCTSCKLSKIPYFWRSCMNSLHPSFSASDIIFCWCFSNPKETHFYQKLILQFWFILVHSHVLRLCRFLSVAFEHGICFDKNQTSNCNCGSKMSTIYNRL